MICRLGSIRGHTLIDNRWTTDELIVKFTVVERSCKDSQNCAQTTSKIELFPSYLSKTEFDNTCRRAKRR